MTVNARSSSHRSIARAICPETGYGGFKSIRLIDENLATATTHLKCSFDQRPEPLADARVLLRVTEDPHATPYPGAQQFSAGSPCFRSSRIDAVDGGIGHGFRQLPF